LNAKNAYRKGSYRTNYQNTISDVAILSATDKKLQRILQRPLVGAVEEKLNEVSTVRKNLQGQVEARRMQELKAATKVGVAYREDKMQSNTLKRMKGDLIAIGAEARRIKIILGWME